MTGGPVTAVLLVLTCGAVGVALAMIASGRPARVLALWLATIAGVPYWVGPSVGGFVPLLVLVSLVGVLALTRGVPRPTARDLVAVSLAFTLVVLGLVGVSQLNDAFVVFGQWGLAFLLGRLLGSADPSRTSRVVAAFGVVLAALAVVEFLLDWHPFAQLVVDNRAYRIWAPVQLRGGVARSEWTLGHSIALGNVLAMTVPFVLSARLGHWRTALSLAVVLGGVTVTFSRSALVTAGLALVLGLLLLDRGRATRTAVPVLMGLTTAGLAVAPLLQQVQGRAAGELAASTAVRWRMLDLLATLRPFGAAGNAVQTADGRTGFNSVHGVFRTLDNTYLLFGLQFGWVPAMALLALLGSWVLLLRRGRGSPALVALVSQLPATLTVAMITQYGAVFWLVAGMALTQVLTGRPPASIGSPAALGSPAPDVGGPPLPRQVGQPLGTALRARG